LAIEPLSNGGCGSYSMPSWIALATSALAICAANHSAMSIPADTPAAVTTLPCGTTRRSRRTASWALNCGCPPGRRVNSTSWRATARASSPP
jgi:hypothetical protein